MIFKRMTVHIMLTIILVAISHLIFRRLFKHTTTKIIPVNNTDEPISLPVFKVKPLVIWANDLHFAPTRDAKYYLKPMGVRFIDKNLDNYRPRCKPRNACNEWKSLKVINPQNAVNLNHELIPQFYEAYKNDSEMKTVDAFACFHASSLCELFEPFNKSLIIISTIRYELGRHSKTAWTTWNRNLVKYASQPWNVVAANNLYDVEYIKYFTGIQPRLLPSWCSYPNLTYNPSRPGFLIAHCRTRDFIGIFTWNFTRACLLINCTVNLTPLRQKYLHYKFSDIATHQGLVYVPYQVSVMSFFEQYRMNIPIFAPTKGLLLEWEMQYSLMYARRLNFCIGDKSNRSAIDPHPSQRSIPDPNTLSREAISYWLSFCDYYQFPHVTYYDSIENLVRILETTRKKQLVKISNDMKNFNMRESVRMRKIWKDILLKIADHSENRPF